MLLKLTILLIFLSREIFCNFQPEEIEEWQDVHELGFKINKKKTETKGECNLNPCTPCEDCGAKELHCGNLKKLLVKLPLNSLIREEEDKEYIEIKIKFDIGELKILKDYALHNCKSNGNEIDSIINKAVRSIEVIPSNKIDWGMLIYDYVTHNQEVLLLIAFTGVIFMLLLWWWTFSKSWTEVAIKGFVLLFVLSSIWDWVRLYKNAIAEKEAGLARAGGEIPIECRPTEMTLMQSVGAFFRGRFSFKEDECQKYYKHFIVDPFWDANPLTAVIDNISRMVFHPLSVLGEYIGHFIRELFSKLPAQLWVPVFITITALVFFLLTMYCKYRFRLPFFLGALEPGDPPQPPRVAINDPGNVAPPVMRIELLNNPVANAQPQICERCENTVSNNRAAIAETETKQTATNIENVSQESFETNVTKECEESSAQSFVVETKLAPNGHGDQVLSPPGNKIETVAN